MLKEITEVLKVVTDERDYLRAELDKALSQKLQQVEDHIDADLERQVDSWRHRATNAEARFYLLEHIIFANRALLRSQGWHAKNCRLPEHCVCGLHEVLNERA